MPAPRPWSFSSLDSFLDCPRRYHEEKVLKTVVQIETEAQRAGIEVHKAFENRLLLGPVDGALPAKYAQHEGYMQGIEAGPGTVKTERKYGITIKLKPCGFYDNEVWHRGIIDVQKSRPDGTGRIVDFKNGKKHNKVRQLHLFSLYGFIEGHSQMQSEFYWTQDRSTSPITLPASHAPVILSSLVPDLTQYKEAWRDNVWPPRRSGLCANYCPVVGCEFHGKRMSDRV